jgi:hypothetical protein
MYYSYVSDFPHSPDNQHRSGAATAAPFVVVVLSPPAAHPHNQGSTLTVPLQFYRTRLHRTDAARRSLCQKIHPENRFTASSRPLFIIISLGGQALRIDMPLYVGDIDGYNEDPSTITRSKREYRRIKENDPTFTKLIFRSIPNDLGMKGLGEAIGRNTNLKEFYINSSYLPSFYFEPFLSGLAVNRSIQKLCVTGWDRHNRDESVDKFLLRK